MDDFDLLDFTPVPVRARTRRLDPRRQYFFILGLARGFTPARAAALLGMTRKTAYELRRKPGAEGFAARLGRGGRPGSGAAHSPRAARASPSARSMANGIRASIAAA